MGRLDEESTNDRVLRDGAEDEERELTAEAAFKIIGNETRLTILDTLWSESGRAPMAFGALRKSVGVRDGSQFNYHLTKLLDGGFVEKVDGEYGIRHAGAEVVWAVRSGYLTEHPDIDSFETPGVCIECGGPLHARYADEMFFVECARCGYLHALGMFPPGALADRTPREALLAYDRVSRANTELASAGICPKCHGRMDRTLTRRQSEIPVRSTYIDPERHAVPAAWHVCSNCSLWLYETPGDAIVEHPDVVAFYESHGVDSTEMPRWELPWTLDESLWKVVSDDPFEVRITVSHDAHELVLTLDETFSVVAVE